MPNYHTRTIPEGQGPARLEAILAAARERAEGLKVHRAELERQAAAAPDPAAFGTALIRGAVGVIAEIKRRSPSAGELNAGLDAPAQAALYQGAGAAAISVLTDGPWFGGSLADLEAAAQQVSVPLLRKDFIVSEEQLLEARIAGASAALLIVRALEPGRLKELITFTADAGLDALVEVHASDELRIALDAGARILGANSRDLDTFRIDRGRALELVAAIPADRIAVAESGMSLREDVERAADAGADAVLVGTALSSAPAPGTALGALTGVPRRGR